MKKLKEINLPSGDYLFVEVPDDAHDLGMETECEVSYRILNGHYKRINTSSLNFSFNVNGIIGFTKDITEEQAGSIVELFSITRLSQFGYKNYLLSKDKYNDFTCKTAKESLQSLIQANGLDVNKNYLILKKINL